MNPRPVSDVSSPVRIPTWIAVPAIALVLALWTFVFAQLIGHHVAAADSARAAAVLAAHARPGA